jgi:FkbM family methyltransferase
MISRLISSLLTRLPPSSTTKEKLVATALRCLPDVAYYRLQERGFEPGLIVDVGAYDGRWSRQVRTIFRNAPILMIEARESERANLAATCDQISNARYEIALLNAESRQNVRFYVHDTGSSLFPERSNVPRSEKTLDSRTLDGVVGNLSFSGPVFLKLDVQGAELEILKGGTDTLNRCELVQLEIALLNYNERSPTAAEVIAFMDSRGFDLFDVVGFIRPDDRNLVQIDAIFARNDSSLRPDFFQF